MHRSVISNVLPLLAFFSLTTSFARQAPTGPLSAPPGTPIQQPPPQTKIVRQVSLVNTPVTVRDPKGEMVDNLEAKDFKVLDNGVPQKITHFDLGGDPLSLVVVVETSSRIAPLMPQIQKSGILVTDVVMGPNGEAAVVGFSDSVDKLQDFTTDHDAIQRTINRLKSGYSGAKLYDAMTIGVEMLSSRPQPTAESPGRRRVMLILSEATDAGSEAKLGEVLRQAQLTNVTIYSVGLSTAMAELKAPPKDVSPQLSPPGTFPQPPMPGTVQTPTTEQARYGSGNLMAAIIWAVQHVKDAVKANPLELVTAGTGGMHVATFKNHSIENAIDDIGGELHSQYSLSYTPTGTNETGFHEIKVSVRKSSLKVRARPGYYIAAPET